MLNVFYIACDQVSQCTATDLAAKKRFQFRLHYQLETIAGIGTFALSHAHHEINVNIYTNHPREWQQHFAPMVSKSFKNLRTISVVDTMICSGGLTVEHPLLTKVRILEQIARDAYQCGLDNAIYLDGDHLSMREWAESVQDIIDDQNYLIAMTHECGLTGLKPIPNYNSGLICFKPSTRINQLIRSWLHYSTSYCDQSTNSFNDQHTLVYSLADCKVKVLTLPEVLNLRCHPEYTSAAHVWSEVYGVHNHDAASIFVAACKMAIDKSTCLDRYFNPAFVAVQQWFNPSGTSHLPRCVSLTASQANELIGQLFNDTWS